MRGLWRWGLLVALLWSGQAWAEKFELKLLDAAVGPKVRVQVDGARLRVESVFPSFDKEVLEGSLAGARLVIVSAGPPGESLVHVVGATGIVQQLAGTGSAPKGAAWAYYDPWDSYAGSWTPSLAPRPAKLSFRVAGDAAARAVAERLRQHLTALRAPPAVAQVPAKPVAVAAKPATVPAAKPPPKSVEAPSSPPSPPTEAEDGPATLRDPEARQVRVIDVRLIDNAQACISAQPKPLQRVSAAGEPFYEHHVWVSNRCDRPVLVLVCYDDGLDCALDAVPPRQLGKFPLSVEAPRKTFSYQVQACFGSYARGCE